MAVDPTLTAQAMLLVQAQAAARDRAVTTTTATVRAAIRTWLTGGGSWRSPSDVTRLTRQLAATTRAGQSVVAGTAAAYWTRQTALLTGRTASADRGAPTGAAPVRRIDPVRTAVTPVPLESVFGRLADNARWLEASRGPATTEPERLAAAVTASWRQTARLALTADSPDLGVTPDGTDITAALLERIHRERDDGTLDAAGLARRLDELVEAHPTPLVAPDVLDAGAIEARILDRAATQVDQALALAYRAQLEASAATDPGTVVGYRRIIHPELGNVCGLCIVAADRVYHRGALLALHPACRCTVLAFTADADPGSAINTLDLTTVYDSVGTTAGRALSETRWRLVDHPEAGAQLVYAGQVRAIERSGGRSRSATGTGTASPSVDPAVVLAVADRSIADLERRRDGGEDVAGPLAFQRGLRDRMARDAA